MDFTIALREFKTANVNFVSANVSFISTNVNFVNALLKFRFLSAKKVLGGKLGSRLRFRDSSTIILFVGLLILAPEVRHLRIVPP